ncbi:D-alanyl-D-alanine carboxypeptidase family protein [Patescibacteria group bacterium]
MRHTYIGLGIFATILLYYPGHNSFQTKIVKTGESKVKGVNIEIEKNDLPTIRKDIIYPEISATAAIAIDPKSSVVLFEKNSDVRKLPASTTKIMTALVVLDEYDLGDVITIGNENLSIGNKSYLVRGERITVINLLYALLVSSGNDAALALAQNHPKGYNFFISQMNQKAKDLHLKNSNFTNVSGLEQPNHYMSARDLAILTKEALKNNIILDVVSTKRIFIESIEGDQVHVLENTNELLGKIDGLMGVKTGWTFRAGECLVSYIERDGREAILVILESNDRFGESEKIIDWIYSNYEWISFPI